MKIDWLKSLVKVMVDNELTRVEIREGETHVLLKRGDAPVVVAPPAPAPLAAPPAESEPTPTLNNELFVRSPMVGTFYSAPDPESPPFVRVGDSLTSESVVCLVEAMKVFNEIKAEQSGRVTRILVQNAEAVEYDQPLFALAPD